MIVIFGASSALAREVVAVLAQTHDVIATYNTTAIAYDCERVREERLDVLDFEAVAALCKRISQEYSRITFLNFASLSVDRLFLDLALDEWHKMVDVNVTSSIVGLQQLIRKMLVERWGRIIFISSAVADRGAVGAAGYSASKAALGGLCKTLAQEYGRFNITCNILKLGYFDGGMIATVPPARLAGIRGRIPNGQLGKCEEIARAIDYLIAADYVNGAALEINGGLQ